MDFVNLPVFTAVFAVTCSIGCFLLWKFYQKFLRKTGGTRIRRAAAAPVAGARRRGLPNIAANRRPPAARMRPVADEDDAGARLIRRAPEPVNQPDGLDDETGDNSQPGSTKKIGTKKAAKLAEKERRKEEREAEERYREHQRKLEDQEIAKRKKVEEEEERIAAEATAAEAKRQEEEAAREQAEYEKLKLDFSVEEEGTEVVQRDTKAEVELNAQLCAAIKEAKIVSVEHLALEFNMKTEGCVDRLKCLLASGLLTGLLDDRGKFVHITPAEYEAVAQFIDKRGRVTLSELVANSAKLLHVDRKM